MTEFIDNAKGGKKEPGKPTEFIGMIHVDIGITKDPSIIPSRYYSVELIRRGNGVDYPFDLMVAKHEDDDDEYWMLGHWNDGC